MTTEDFFTPPTAFWKCVSEGMCIWDTVMAELGIEISNNDSWLKGTKNRKFSAKLYRTKMFELIILAF